MNDYYVYEWYNVDTGEVFYVGKGKKTDGRVKNQETKDLKNIINFIIVM